MRAFFRAAAMVALAVSAVSPAEAQSRDRPVVEVAQGRLAGIAADDIRVFKAVPYAAPPVGPRRWQPPGPAPRWQGTRDASTFGPSCVQPPVPPQSLYYSPPAAMREDCLTLNIWAPAKVEHAPVILWIHGGSLRIGGSAEPMYDGSVFARRGIVFVSINYRLGVLGYLAHPELSAESPRRVSGNYGLLDQVDALRWMRSNIAAFGGDADNVTVMGESAGALSATYLLVSPLARGLFAKAILQSTNLRPLPGLRAAAFGLSPAENTGVKFTRDAGAADLAALRAMDAETLAGVALRTRFIAEGTMDGWALPRQLLDAFDAGEFARVPMITGFTSGEMRAGLLPIGPVPDEAGYRQALQHRYGEFAPRFLALYPATDVRESMFAALRDGVFSWSSERLVRRFLRAGAPAYLYLFDHCYPAAATKGICAFHASELPFVFGQVGASAELPVNWPRPVSEADRQLSDAMIGYWTAFARSGDPQADGLPQWESYATNEAFMRLAEHPKPETDPLPGMFEAHNAWVENRRQAGRQWFPDRR